MLERLKIKPRDYEKRAFYPSDFGKSSLDIYFGLKGTPQTNPPVWFDTLKWGAGRGVEDAMLKVLKDSGIVQGDYNQKENGRVEVVREGVQINGYIDAINMDGEPIEIKSINNKNQFDINRYRKKEPRENYVGQLAVYMDCLGVDKGHLFVSSVDGLNRFWFYCSKISDGKYKCGNTVVDVKKEYKRWRAVSDMVKEGREPDYFEYRYKKPLLEIDWKSLSKTEISKARNGRKVIGDWQVTFSPWKDLIIEKQGDSLGYSDEEIEFIREATKGYTTWN